MVDVGTLQGLPHTACFTSTGHRVPGRCESNLRNGGRISCAKCRWRHELDGYKWSDPTVCPFCTPPAVFWRLKTPESLLGFIMALARVMMTAVSTRTR